MCAVSVVQPRDMRGQQRGVDEGGTRKRRDTYRNWGL